jgi:hypothetical protein
MGKVRGRNIGERATTADERSWGHVTFKRTDNLLGSTHRWCLLRRSYFTEQFTCLFLLIASVFCTVRTSLLHRSYLFGEVRTEKSNTSSAYSCLSADRVITRHSQNRHVLWDGRRGTYWRHCLTSFTNPFTVKLGYPPVYETSKSRRKTECHWTTQPQALGLNKSRDSQLFSN